MTDGRTPAEAERAIDHTRAELARTLDALERRLTARHFVEKGFEMLRDSFTGNQINRGFELIRANPIPAALIGIGSAWLIANSTGLSERVAQDERVRAAGRTVAETAKSAGTRAGQLASDMASRVGVGGGEEPPLGQVGNPVVDGTRAPGSSWMHQAMRSARDAGGAVLNRAGSLAGGSAGRAADQVSDAFERHPLVAGGIAVMAGALAAALLPLSRAEQELIGNTREELWQRAQQAGQEAASRMREAASRAATRAVDAAAEAARETMREELREEIAKPSHR